MATQAHNVLSDSLFASDNIDKYKKEYNTSKPFPLVRIDSCLKNEFITKLESSLDKDISFHEKNNDLYQFYQSYGLDQLPEDSAINHLTKALYSDKFRELLSKITGIKVNEKADLFASCYTDTSYLLCHDDQVEDRRIAFILYLTPSDWNESDGGALNIYNSYKVNSDSPNNNNSNAISVNVFPETKPFKQLLPKRNSVVIFKVSDISFHEVDEVLTTDKNRIAIGGWWHDETMTEESKQKKIAIPDPVIVWKEAMTSTGDKLMNKWINPTYLKADSQQKLQAKFVEESHLTLLDFLNEELYYKLLQQLFVIKCQNDEKLGWKLKGPIHRRLYYCLNAMNNGDDDDNLLVVEFKELMESVQWKAFIQSITSLDLLKYNMETRKFEHGHYTLAHDLDRFKDIPGLDVNLQFVEKEENGWDTDFGGSIHYTLSKEVDDNKEEEGEDDDDNILMSVHTFPNALSITYRSEGGVMSFVKYINHNAPCSKIDFNQIWTVDDDDSDDGDEKEAVKNDKKRKLDENEESNEPPSKKQKV